MVRTSGELAWADGAVDCREVAWARRGLSPVSERVRSWWTFAVFFPTVVSPPPDFVIVGAPKCGTTSLYRALREHPGIFFPAYLKEPHYFAFDFPNRQEVTSADDYDFLFADAKPGQLRGEASVLYLRSEQAVGAILKRRPDCKIIAMVRNPIEMFVSWHNENVLSLDEDQADPIIAWRLQAERAHGRQIPRLCKEPNFLQYREICSLGRQVQRMFSKVPASQRLVLALDDLIFAPTETHSKVTGFLGIENSGFAKFEQANSFRQQRNRISARIGRFILTHSWAKQMRLQAKPFLNSRGIHPLAWLNAANTRPVAKPRLSPKDEAELRAVFDEDISILEDLLERDLSNWKLAPSPRTHRTRST